MPARTRKTARMRAGVRGQEGVRGRRRAHGPRVRGRRWSAEVTRTSNALDLEPRVFTGTPRQIALSLKRSAERSRRRKSTPFRSAMSMLTFYENRAGRNLPRSRREALRRAKDELRKIYRRPGSAR